jgi:hypothetical protein
MADSQQQEAGKDAASVPALVLDGSAKVLGDPEPLSAASLEYERYLKEERAKDYADSVKQGLGNDFKDFRRESDATQPPDTPVEKVKNVGRRLTHELRGLRGLVPGKEVSHERIVAPSVPATPTQVVGEGEEAGDKSPAVKSPTVKSPTSAGFSREHAASLQDNAAEWMLAQDPTLIPNGAFLEQQAQELLDAAELEFTLDESRPKPEDLEPLGQSKMAEWTLEQCEEQYPDGPSRRAKMDTLLAEDGQDPRHSFRTAAKDQYVPKEDRKLTWIESIMADYPGPLHTDVLLFLIPISVVFIA